MVCPIHGRNLAQQARNVDNPNRSREFAITMLVTIGWLRRKKKSTAGGMPGRLVATRCLAPWMAAGKSRKTTLLERSWT